MATQTNRRAGRPRAFDETTVLDRAVDVFWRLGYRSTTTRDLEQHLGISQSSLYNTFGSKRDLLLAAIDRYEDRIRGELFSILTDSDGGVDSVDAFVEQLGRWIVTNEHRGCLVVNLMADGSDDPRIAHRASAYRATIRTALYSALVTQGDCTDDIAAQRSELLLGAILGLHITARSSGDARESAAMIAALRAEIGSWR